MFIAIVGTRCSGKSTIQEYLVKYRDFKPVKILQNISDKVGQFQSSLLAIYLTYYHRL